VRCTPCGKTAVRRCRGNLSMLGEGGTAIIQQNLRLCVPRLEATLRSELKCSLAPRTGDKWLGVARPSTLKRRRGFSRVTIWPSTQLCPSVRPEGHSLAMPPIPPAVTASITPFIRTFGGCCHLQASETDVVLSGVSGPSSYRCCARCADGEPAVRQYGPQRGNGEMS
jgi:hypothetical protein